MIKTAKSLTTHEEDINTDLIIEMPAPELGAVPPAPPPKTTLISVDYDRGVVWLTNHQSGKLRRYFRWSPSSGVTRQYDLNTDPELRETDFDVRSIVETEKGIIFFGTQKKPDNEIFVFVTRKENVYTLKRVAERYNPYLLPLRDGSILMAGGITNNSGKTQKFTNAIERINIDTKRISIEPLPNLPGNPRRDISWVELNDGRVMALGGTESQYVGYPPMSAESYLLNLAKKSWQPGPRMIKARSGASATVLPDNTVLVVGGWTPEETWNDAPSRSTERWDTHSTVFAPDLPLPIGIANHKAQWIQLERAKHLLLSGGWLAAHNDNEAVFALDQNNKLWNMAALQCKSGNSATPLPYNGKPYMWCSPAFNESDLVSLQLSGDKPGTVQLSSDSNGIVLHRTGIAFLPPVTDFPALAIGGRIENADSALVDALWLDGRMQSLAPLNHARRNAKVFRLRDGSILVFGGSAGDSSRRTLHVPPIELLPFNPSIEKARWIDVEFNVVDISSLGMLKEGSLLAVHSSGEMERLTIVVSPEKIAVQRTPFPSLNRPRIELPYGASTGIKIRELADGRIILAGGFTQYHRMALMHDDVDKDDAPDHFTYLGEFSPSHNYEIYDPKSRRWSESATSNTNSAAPAIFDDGRVVKWGGVWCYRPLGSGRYHFSPSRTGRGTGDQQQRWYGMEPAQREGGATVSRLERHPPPCCSLCNPGRAVSLRNTADRCH